jgi:hypothetical protein
MINRGACLVLFLSIATVPACSRSRADRIISDFKAMSEPKKQGIAPLQTAVEILQSKELTKDDLHLVGVRTYSTTINEKVLRERYGEPDEISTFQGARTLKYGWLVFAVSEAGEIGGLLHFRRPQKDGEVFRSVIVDVSQ